MRLVVIVILAIATAMASPGRGMPDDQTPEAVEKWFEKLAHAEQKMSKLRFYFNNFLSELTAVQVAQANITSTSPTSFGAVFVVDFPLTAGPELDSEAVGFAQGLYIFTSQEELAALISLTLLFTNGKYSGSTLSFVGCPPVGERYREYSVMGGSGDFRLAQGVGTVQTYLMDHTTGNEILQFDLMLLQY